MPASTANSAETPITVTAFVQILLENRKTDPGNRILMINAFRAYHQVIEDVLGPSCGLFLLDAIAALHDLDNGIVSPVLKKRNPVGEGEGNRPPNPLPVNILQIHAVACVGALTRVGQDKATARQRVADWLTASGISTAYRDGKISGNTLKHWENKVSKDRNTNAIHREAINAYDKLNNISDIEKCLQNAICVTGTFSHK